MAALLLVVTQAAAQDPDKWGAHIDLEGKFGSERHLGEGSFFWPLMQSSDTMLFGDLRLRADNHDSQEGNIGLGVRHLHESGWNFGGYGYLDLRRTDAGHMFPQATIGFEALSIDWDFRVNGYIPFGDRSKTISSTPGGTTASLSGATVLVTTTPGSSVEERSLSGFDAEIGWRAPLFEEESDKQLRFYAGGYRFAADKADTVAGPRGRVDFTIQSVPFLWEGSRLSVGAEVQHDNPRGTQGFAGFRLRIPLQSEERSTRLTAMERRMTDTVVRDIDVVSGSNRSGGGPSTVETATATADGKAIKVISATTTTGANLPTAVVSAGANSQVILVGLFNTSATVNMQTGQTLMGAGTFAVRAPSGATAMLTTPGGTISNTTSGANVPGINMVTNSTLYGMTVIRTANTSPVAVSANGSGNPASGAKVINNTITVTANVNGSAFGMSASNGVTGIEFRGNTVTARHNGTGNTIAAEVINNVQALVSDNTLTATGGTPRAISIVGGGNTVSGSGNTLVAGPCFTSGGVTGSIGLTSGGTCP